MIDWRAFAILVVTETGWYLVLWAIKTPTLFRLLFAAVWGVTLSVFGINVWKR